MTIAQTAAVLAAAVAGVALLLVVGAHLRLNRLRRRLHRNGSGDSQSADLAAEVAALRADVAAARRDAGAALRNVAVVRYDAFGDVGGRMSFSVALVDDAGDGVVISSIHARSESRTYAKGVVRGSSEVVLTPEEQEALAAARSGTTVRRERADGEGGDRRAEGARRDPRHPPR